MQFPSNNCIKNTYQGGMFASFGSPHKVVKHTLSGKYFLQFVLHINFGLSGPLWTAFELKIELPTAKNQPAATAPTENAINWLTLPTNIQIYFRFFPKFPKYSNGKSGGIYIFSLKNLYICIYIYIY